MLRYALLNLDDSSNSGPDQIPPIFTKRCCSVLIGPLLFVFNKSVKTASFPCLWKLSYILPIHKSGDKHYVQNFRPIAILNWVAKLLDSIFTSHISDFISAKISEEHHGFMKGRSMITNLLLYHSSVSNALESYEQVDSVYRLCQGI